MDVICLTLCIWVPIYMFCDYFILSLSIETNNTDINSNDINSNRIESILSFWELSSEVFPYHASNSIVGCDEENMKIIIIGGQKDQKSIYLYDIILNKLLTITHSIIGTKSQIFDTSSTNAVIIDSIMYFGMQRAMSSINLTYIYSISDDYLPLSNITITNIYIDNQYGAYSCIVSDENNISNKNYLFLSAMSWHNNVIIYDIHKKSTYVVASTNTNHRNGECVIINGTLYIIGGKGNNSTEYIQIEILINNIPTQKDLKLSVFPSQFDVGLSSSGIVVAKYYSDHYSHHLIYILGGDNDRQTSVHRINLTSQTIQLLDIELPFNGILETRTIYVQKLNQIFTFRGENQGVSIKYTKPDYTHIPTLFPTYYPSMPSSTNSSHGSFAKTLMFGLDITEWIVILILTCFLIICCCIGILWIKMTKNVMRCNENQPNVYNIVINRDILSGLECECNRNKVRNINDKQQRLLTVTDHDHDDTYLNVMHDNQDEDESSQSSLNKENRLINASINKSRQNELFLLYKISRLECLKKCEEMGLSDDFVDELFNEFDVRINED